MRLKWCKVHDNKLAIVEPEMCVRFVAAEGYTSSCEFVDADIIFADAPGLSVESDSTVKWTGEAPAPAGRYVLVEEYA